MNTGFSLLVGSLGDLITPSGRNGLQVVPSQLLLVVELATAPFHGKKVEELK
jgi:hypothetical protein